MRMSSRSLLTALAGLALGACKKPESPPAKAAPADASPADEQDVAPRPIAKKETAPGAAANGKNVPVDLGDAPTGPAPEDRGRLVLRWEGEDGATRKLVRASRVFDKLVPQLDESLRLPRDIEVVFDDCDEANAFYDDETVEITMCNEYLDYYGELFSEYPDDEARDAVIGTVVSTFLHEIGHALIAQLELPAVGREEDAADQLSTVILIASGDEGQAMALEGAYSFIEEAEASEDDDEETPFWDEHSLDEQRFYNGVCLIYGSDPDGWDDLVGDDDLPEERAEQCADEYALVSKSWNRLLAPYLTVPAVKVKLPE